MAICSDCDQEMTDGVACTDPVYVINGEVYDRVPNGELTCHDCKAPPGALHHPGCDSERCPVCHGQSISCECDGEEDRDDE